MPEGSELGLGCGNPTAVASIQPIPPVVKADLAAFTGCVAGAAAPAEIEVMLSEAGFGEIRVEVKAASRDFINDWLPDRQAGDYGASAIITGRKPSR